MSTPVNKSFKNNFNVLRLIFAIFVLITHSFVLSDNTIKEPLGLLTSGQVNFSYVGLRGFFTISGFLIFQSYLRSVSGLEFMRNRILRILPGLIAVSIFTILIVCPLISSYSIRQYFSIKNTYLIFIESIDPLFNRNTHASAPGVFEKNVYTDQLNGSLWTISYEFFFIQPFCFCILKKTMLFTLLQSYLLCCF
jgi:peptidoglycan/LPS O-acetylase OafA/YrhL